MSINFILTIGPAYTNLQILQEVQQNGKAFKNQ